MSSFSFLVEIILGQIVKSEETIFFLSNEEVKSMTNTQSKEMLVSSGIVPDFYRLKSFIPKILSAATPNTFIELALILFTMGS